MWVVICVPLVIGAIALVLQRLEAYLDRSRAELAMRAHAVMPRLPDGSVVVAGQSHDTTTAYAADVLALRAAREGHPPPLPDPRGPWVSRLQELDPRVVVFAHDYSVWVP